jgi:hypothetical protein
MAAGPSRSFFGSQSHYSEFHFRAVQASVEKWNETFLHCTTIGAATAYIPEIHRKNKRTAPTSGIDGDSYSVYCCSRRRLKGLAKIKFSQSEVSWVIR